MRRSFDVQLYEIRLSPNLDKPLSQMCALKPYTYYSWVSSTAVNEEESLEVDTTTSLHHRMAVETRQS